MKPLGNVANPDRNNFEDPDPLPNIADSDRHVNTSDMQYRYRTGILHADMQICRYAVPVL